LALVVDDEPLILKIVSTILAPEIDVIAESRAEAALARIRAGERFAVILCDLMMPGITGMDLHDALLEIAPDQARVMVFVTGGAFTSRAREFLDRVSNSTIDKPFNSACLLARVREVIR